jgi:hypothetical protein
LMHLDEKIHTVFTDRNAPILSIWKR